MRIPPNDFEQAEPPEFIVTQTVGEKPVVMRRVTVYDGSLGYGGTGAKRKYHPHWSYRVYATFDADHDAFEFVRLMEYRATELGAFSERDAQHREQPDSLEAHNA